MASQARAMRRARIDGVGIAGDQNSGKIRLQEPDTRSLARCSVTSAWMPAHSRSRPASSNTGTANQTETPLAIPAAKAMVEHEDTPLRDRSFPGIYGWLRIVRMDGS